MNLHHDNLKYFSGKIIIWSWARTTGHNNGVGHTLMDGVSKMNKFSILQKMELFIVNKDFYDVYDALET